MTSARTGSPVLPALVEVDTESRLESMPGVVLAAARAAHPDRLVVVCPEHTHSATVKAARLLELEIRAIPTDDVHAMRAR